jgi:SAM-dependent methyltransferase
MDTAKSTKLYPVNPGGREFERRQIMSDKAIHGPASTEEMPVIGRPISKDHAVPVATNVQATGRCSKRLARKTEFYETAVRLGFYGADSSGLTGKKDNVRKYWEDIVIKLSVRPFVERLLERKESIRVIDLGSGSGEGVELLTHIPVSDALRSVDKPFLLDRDAIGSYVGLDISPGMVEQGQINYADWPNARFAEADLAKGFPLLDQEPFDLYFSSYASLSHLTPTQLSRLIRDITEHVCRRAYLVLDLMGRFSPEWPGYWATNRPRMLPYNMGYLFHSQGRQHRQVDSHNVCYWAAGDLKTFIDSLSAVPGKSVRIVELRDRSVLVGRHIDTGSFNGQPRWIRNAVNRLFHRDYRGSVSELLVDVSFVDEYRSARPEAWERIELHREQWNTVIRFVDALARSGNGAVREALEQAPAGVADDLKLLEWLHRNAARFPVVDFWASVMGPQIACVLRNLELSLPEGLGCGHGLLCILEISEM